VTRWTETASRRYCRHWTFRLNRTTTALKYSESRNVHFGPFQQDAYKMMSVATHFRSLQPLPGVALAFATAMLAALVRHHFVEPDRLGLSCQTVNPWWCTPRTLFIVFSQGNGYGWISAGLAVLAVLWLWRGRDPVVFAVVAMGFGGAGLMLYNVTMSCVAVVVAALVLAHPRVQAT